MKILALGCSFTYGNELPDCDLVNNNPSKQVWANLIAERFDAELVNMSRPGGSNSRNFRLAIRESVKDYDLILCQWSDINRLDLRANGTELQINASSEHYMKIYPWLVDFYKHHVEMEHNWIFWMSLVIALQNHFRINNQKYIFLSMNSPHYSIHYPTKYPELVSQLIMDNFIGFDVNEGMVDWQGDYKSSGGHPLESGHQIIANKVYERIRYLYK